MRTIRLEELESDMGMYEEVVQVLRDDGIVCMPVNTTYRLATNLMSPKAVVNLMQVKRRSRAAPVLVFVPDRAALDQIVDAPSAEVERLMDRFWPGVLTLKMKCNGQVPKKVVKNLGSKGVMGVRVPRCAVAGRILKEFGGPLMISSANPSSKAGANSVAQIKKNFTPLVDIFIDAGELTASKRSTVIDLTKASPKLAREGEIGLDEVMAVWEGG